MPSDVKPKGSHRNSNNFRARWEFTHWAMLAKCSIKYRVLMGVQFPCTQSSEQIINPDGCPLQNPYFAAIPWPFQFWKSTTNNPKTNHYQSYLRQLDIFAWFQRCVRRVILEVFANFATQSFTLKSNFISVSKCGILKSTSWCPGARLWGTAAQQCWIMAIYRHAASKI